MEIQIDFDFDLISEDYPPDEPVPTHIEKDWEDSDEEEELDDAVVNHYLEKNLPKPHMYTGQQKAAPDHKARIEREREHWKLQESDLLKAYMEWRIEGQHLEVDGENMDWFMCTITGIKGVSHVQLYLGLI